MIDVTVLYAGLCGSDISKIRQNGLEGLQDMGHEIVGVVETSDSIDFQKGDFVVVNPFVCKENCKECSYQSYIYCNKCNSLGKSPTGGFSGHIVVPSRNLFKLDIPNEALPVGVLVDGVAVVMHLLHNATSLKSKKCLVIGSGTMGIITYLILSDAYGLNVSIVVRYQDKINELNNIIQCDKINYILENNVLSNEFDVVIEAVGGGQVGTLDLAISACKTDSEIYVLGAFNQDINGIINYRALFYKQTMIKGINSYCSYYDDFQKAVQWVSKNYKLLTPLITSKYKFDDMYDICERFMHCTTNRDIKIVFEP